MAELETLMAGIAFGESPRWHDGRLWFADWGAGELIALTPDGDHEVVTRVNSFPFCFDWLPGGQLLVVNSRERRLVRFEEDGSVETHADLARLADKPWNEIVVDRRGNAFVNCIGFDFPAGEPGPGFVAVVTPDGDLRRVADEVAFPNGMAILPDESTLIVAESYGQCLTAFDIEDDGSLVNRRLWAKVDGPPDGICADADGAVWYADVPNKGCVRVAEGGAVLDSVELDRGCFACMLGGGDGRTLFIVGQEWGGPEAMAAGERSGVVVATRAPAPRAGRP
jgi:sugar lactone lactonase YvrE